jgi:hypothetical protein
MSLGKGVAWMPERGFQHQNVAFGHLSWFSGERGRWVQVTGVDNACAVRARDAQLRRPQNMASREQLEREGTQVKGATVRDRQASA